MNINPFRKPAPLASTSSPAAASQQPAIPQAMYANPRRPIPDTTDGKLAEIIKRLGRMERDIIEIRNKVAPHSGIRLEPEVNYDHF